MTCEAEQAALDAKVAEIETNNNAVISLADQISQLDATIVNQQSLIDAADAAIAAAQADKTAAQAAKAAAESDKATKETQKGYLENEVGPALETERTALQADLDACLNQ